MTLKERLDGVEVFAEDRELELVVRASDYDALKRAFNKVVEQRDEVVKTNYMENGWNVEYAMEDLKKANAKVLKAYEGAGEE